MSQISEQRREQIVSTARRIVDEKGPACLTAEAITHEVGVSRPLLYHYYTNMGDLLAAVIDIYVGEFAEKLGAWEAAAPQDLAEDAGAWSASFVELVRGDLVDGCPLLVGSAQGCSGAYPQFVATCADMIAKRACEDSSPALAPLAKVANARERLHFSLLGLWGMLRSFPEASTAEAAALFAALWFDGSVKAPAAAPAEPAAGEKAPRRGLFGRIFS